MASNKSTTSSPVIAAPIHVAKGSDQGLSSLSATKALGVSAVTNFGPPVSTKRVSKPVKLLNVQALGHSNKVKAQENQTPPRATGSRATGSSPFSSPNRSTPTLKRLLKPAKKSPPIGSRSVRTPVRGGGGGVDKLAFLKRELQQAQRRIKEAQEEQARQEESASEEATLRRELADAQRVIESLREGSGAKATSNRFEKRGESLTRQGEQGDVDVHLVENLRRLFGVTGSKVGGTLLGFPPSPTRTRLAGVPLTQSEVQQHIFKQQQEEISKKDVAAVRKAMSTMQGAWTLFAERGFFDSTAPSPDGSSDPVPLPNYPFYTFMWSTLMAIATSPQYNWPVAARYYSLLMKHWTRKSARLEPRAADGLLRTVWGYNKYDGQIDSILRVADSFILAEAKATAGKSTGAPGRVDFKGKATKQGDYVVECKYHKQFYKVEQDHSTANCKNPGYQGKKGGGSGASSGAPGTP